MLITIYFWIFTFSVIENSVSALKKGKHHHVVNETRNRVGADIQLPHSLYEKLQEQEARKKNKYKTTQKTTTVHHLDINTTIDYGNSSHTTEQGQVAAFEQETQSDKAVHTQNVTESNQKLPDETHTETEPPTKTNLNPIVTGSPQKTSIRRKRTQYPKNEHISRSHKNAKWSDVEPIRRSHYSFGQKRKIHNNNDYNKNSKRTNLRLYRSHNAGKPTKRKLGSNVSINTNPYRKRVRNRDGTKRSHNRNSRSKNAFGVRSQSSSQYKKSNSSSIVNLKATGKSERVDNSKNQKTLNSSENRPNQNYDGKQNNNTDPQISNTKNIPSFRTGGNKSNKKRNSKNKKKINTRFKHTSIYGKRNGSHLRMFENKVKSNKIGRRKFQSRSTLSRNDDNYSLKEEDTKNHSNNINHRKSGKRAPLNFRTGTGSISKLVAKHTQDLEQRSNDSHSKSTTEGTLNSRVGKDKHTSSRTNLVPSAKSQTITDKKYLSRKLKKRKLKIVTEQLQNKISTKTGKDNSVKTKNRENESKGEHADNIGNIDGNNMKNKSKQKLDAKRSEIAYGPNNITEAKDFRNKNQTNDVNLRKSNSVSAPSVRLDNGPKKKEGNKNKKKSASLRRNLILSKKRGSVDGKKYERSKNKAPKKYLQNRFHTSNRKTRKRDSKKKKSRKGHDKESTRLKSDGDTKLTFRIADNNLAKELNSKTQSKQKQNIGRSEITERHGSSNRTETKRHGNKNQTDDANRQKSNQLSAPGIVLRNSGLDNSPKSKKVNDNKKHQRPKNETLKKQPQNRLNTSNLKIGNRDSEKNKSNKISLRKSDSNAKLSFRIDNNNLAKELNSETQSKQKQNTEGHGSSNKTETKRHGNKNQTNDVSRRKSKGVNAPGVVLRNSRLDNNPKSKKVNDNKKHQRPENKTPKKRLQNRLNSSSLKSGNRDSEKKKSNIKSRKVHSKKSIRRKFNSNTQLAVRTNDKNLVKKKISKTQSRQNLGRRRSETTKTHGLSNRMRTKDYGNKNRPKSNSVGASSVKLRNSQPDNGPKGKNVNVKKNKHPKNKTAGKQLKKRINTSNLKAGNRNSIKTQKNRNKTRKVHRKFDTKTKLTFRNDANNFARKQNSKNRGKQRLDTRRPETLKARGSSKKLTPSKSNNPMGKKTFDDKGKKRFRNDTPQKYLRNKLNGSDLKIGLRDLAKKKSGGNQTREAYINNYGLNFRFGHNWLDNNGQDIVVNKSRHKEQHKNIPSGKKLSPSSTSDSLARKIFDARQFFNGRTPMKRIYKKINTSSGTNSHKILRENVEKRMYNAKYDGRERNKPISAVQDQHNVIEKASSAANSKLGIANNITAYLLKQGRDWQLNSTPTVYKSGVVHPKPVERKYTPRVSEHFGSIVRNSIVNTNPSNVLEVGSRVGNNSAKFDGQNPSYAENRNVSRATDTGSLSTKAIENTTTEKSNDLEPNKPAIVNYENGTEYSITNVTRTKYSPNGVQLGEFNETIVKTVYKTYSIMKMSSEGENFRKELLQKIIGQ